MEAYGAVGDGGELLVVGDNDEGLPSLVAQVEEELVQFLLVFRVERAAGFIGQDDRRTVHQGPRHGHTLFFAARELCGLMVGTIFETHELQQFVGPLAGFVLAGACNQCRNHHVLDGRKFGQELMKLKHEANLLIAEVAQPIASQVGDVCSIDADSALVGFVERADDLQQGGFSRAAGAYNAHNLAWLNIEINAFKHFELPERFVYILNVYHLVI